LLAVMPWTVKAIISAEKVQMVSGGDSPCSGLCFHYFASVHAAGSWGAGINFTSPTQELE